MIDEKKLIEEIHRLINTDELEGNKPAAVLCEVLDRIREMPKVGEWIPFTIDEDGYLDCKLPEIDEEILASDGKTVWNDTFMGDGLDGYYLESGYLDGFAWMSLPEPWEKQKC